MKFSHLIQINDLRDPAIPPLSRAQLWRGLVARAEKPSYFLIGLDECAILERGENTLQRKLRFGNLIVRDRVWFQPLDEVRYEIDASPETPGGSLLMKIEEPEAMQLFVRFEYVLLDGDTAAEEYYNEFRKSAYVESDIDTIRMIRQLAASGLLEIEQ
jgi:hypothetical protein